MVIYISANVMNYEMGHSQWNDGTYLMGINPLPYRDIF